MNEYETFKNGVVAGLSNYQEILTVKEAAEILRISKGKVYDMIKSEELMAIHVGRCIKVCKQSIILFILSSVPQFAA